MIVASFPSRRLLAITTPHSLAAPLLVLTLALALAGCASDDIASSPDTSGSVSAASISATASPPASASALERDLFNRVNAYRRSRGRDPLGWNSHLASAAHAHSRDMASKGRMSHAGFSSRAFVLRTKVDVRWISENVAYFKGSSDLVGKTIQGWKNSTDHHRNLLHKRDFITGVGIVRGADGYVYFTQLFGG